jgi:hypothetical protein
MTDLFDDDEDDAPQPPARVLNAPERIHLVFGDLEFDGKDVEFSECEEVMWCEDKQWDSDVEYVRADLPQQVAVDLTLPPFGHGFTIPVPALDNQALRWLQENCVLVTKEEWDRVRDLARGPGGPAV